MLERGHIDKAMTHYRRALEIDPQNVDVHFNLGRVFFQQRRLADAIGEYERVVAIQPNDPEAYLSLGNPFAAAASEKRAIAKIEKALDLAPDSVSVLNNLAWLHGERIRSESAQSDSRDNAGRKSDRTPTSIKCACYHTLAAADASAGKSNDAISGAERSQQLAEQQGDATLANAV